ncbi:hypothetical protein [Phenylobacterium sp.]|uniref:hypothetical protein n=1 Tax=Phenylobacterium sp. TaxID=1871053 RepID=UPI00301DE668
MYEALIKPTPDAVKRWGALAYVSDADRQRILALPSGQSKMVVAQLQREVAAPAKKATPARRGD